VPLGRPFGGTQRHGRDHDRHGRRRRARPAGDARRRCGHRRPGRGELGGGRHAARSDRAGRRREDPAPEPDRARDSCGGREPMNTQTQTVLPLETEPAAPAPDEASPVEAAIRAAEPAPEAEAAGDAAEAPADAEPAESTPLIRLHEQLEEARSLIEVRFSEAGARLAGALDMVGNLIASLEGLGAALDSSGSGGTTKDL